MLIQVKQVEQNDMLSLAFHLPRVQTHLKMVQFSFLDCSQKSQEIVQTWVLMCK